MDFGLRPSEHPRITRYPSKWGYRLAPHNGFHVALNAFPCSATRMRREAPDYSLRNPGIGSSFAALRAGIRHATAAAAITSATANRNAREFVSARPPMELRISVTAAFAAAPLLSHEKSPRDDRGCPLASGPSVLRDIRAPGGKESDHAAAVTEALATTRLPHLRPVTPSCMRPAWLTSPHRAASRSVGAVRR